MIQEFQQFAKENQLFEKGDKIIVASSGGMDSMVLTDLLLKSKKEIVLAHCNFQLRAEESDMDEQFLKSFALSHSIPFYSTSFNTSSYAKEKGISIQMAARELRYDWFNQVAEETGIKLIATAHHLDDQLESVIIGSLRNNFENLPLGIAIKRHNLIRPLLYTNRSRIEKYATKQKIDYRTDSSNQQKKYLRNRIRHDVVPILKDLSPNLEFNLVSSLQQNQMNELLYSKLTQEFIEKDVIDQKQYLKIDISKIDENSIELILLSRYLRDFGFRSQHIQSLLKHKSSGSGKLLNSASHELLLDRNMLLLRELQQQTEKKCIRIDNLEFNLCEPFKLESQILSVDTKADLKTSTNQVLLDLDRITPPLYIRKWEKGDEFIPFGMKGKKKISDFLIDEKINRFDKEQVWVLLSENEIIWVIGYRADNRYRVHSTSKKILKITNDQYGDN